MPLADPAEKSTMRSTPFGHTSLKATVWPALFFARSRSGSLGLGMTSWKSPFVLSLPRSLSKSIRRSWVSPRWSVGSQWAIVSSTTTKRVRKNGLYAWSFIC